MDALVVVGIAVVLAGAYYLFTKDRDSESKDSGSSGTGGFFKEEQPKVNPAATQEAAAVKATKKKLPTDSKLQAMTKAKLAEYAKAEFDVELSKNKTKLDMIAELRKAVK